MNSNLLLLPLLLLLLLLLVVVGTAVSGGRLDFRCLVVVQLKYWNLERPSPAAGWIFVLW